MARYDNKAQIRVFTANLNVGIDKNGLFSFMRTEGAEDKFIFEVVLGTGFGIKNSASLGLRSYFNDPLILTLFSGTPILIKRLASSLV